MRPTFIQLEAFYWIARLGSVKEAARQLRVAPPTISLRIDDLEAELGSSLFERAGRGIALTQRGEALVPTVAAVIEAYGRIRAAVEGQGDNSGILRIGATETFAQACLPQYLRIMGQRHPTLQLDFAITTSADLERDVLERRLDIAFAVNPTGDPKLTLVPLGLQPLTWVAPQSFGLPSPLHPADLQGVPVIINPHPAPMWRQITDWFRQAGLEPSKVIRCASPTVVSRLVHAGVGASLLPQLLAKELLGDGRVCQLESGVALQPSRVFAIHRFADGGRLMQDVIALGQQVMADAKLTMPGGV